MMYIYEEVSTAYSAWPRREFDFYGTIWKCFCYSSDFEKLYAKCYKYPKAGQRTYVFPRTTLKKG